MKIKVAIVVASAVFALAGQSADAQQFTGGCLSMNTEQCANTISPGIWQNLGGGISFWETYESGIGGGGREPTPEERQQCVAACNTRHQQAISDCIVGLQSSATDPDEVDAAVAHASCVNAMAPRFNECVADCWAF